MNQIELFCRMHHVEHKLSGECGYPRGDWPEAYRQHLLPIWDSYCSPHGTLGAPDEMIITASLSTVLSVTNDVYRCLFMLEHLTHHIPDTLVNFSSVVLVDNLYHLLTQHQHETPETTRRPDWDIHHRGPMFINYMDESFEPH